MKTRNFLATLVILLFIINACKELPSTVLSDNSGPANMPASGRGDVSYNDMIAALKLGMIDVLENETLIEIINERAVADDDADEVVTLGLLEAEAAKNNIDLINLMASSVIANGGTAGQAALVEAYYNGFSNGANSYTPMIYIPFSEALTFSEDIILASGGENVPMSVWYGQKYVNGNFSNNIAITEAVAESTPVFVVTATNTGGGGWLPWRRCWCTIGSRDGEGGINTVGACTRHNGNSTPNSRCHRCGRSHFAGECDGDSCMGC